MKSVERVFNKIVKENPYWSDYTCFAETVWGENYSKKTIAENFNKLVNRDDYCKAEKKAIVAYLLKLTNLKRP